MLIEMPETKLGKNIFILRKNYYLSRKALAKLIGISVYQLKVWEEEVCNPVITWEQLKRISAIFDIPSEILVHKNMENIVAPKGLLCKGSCLRSRLGD